MSSINNSVTTITCDQVANELRNDRENCTKMCLLIAGCCAATVIELML